MATNNRSQNGDAGVRVPCRRVKKLARPPRGLSIREKARVVREYLLGDIVPAASEHELVRMDYSSLPINFLFTQRERIIDFASSKRIPAAYGIREYVPAGGPFALGANRRENCAWPHRWTT